MSEMRQDPVTREWVIIARERARRPDDFARDQAKPEIADFDSDCPFCPGNEAMTPPEVLSYPDDGGHGWRVRAFANKFAALTPEGSTVRREEKGLFLTMDGVGLHEVIVETPVHNKALASMDEVGVHTVLLAYQERYRAMSQMPHVALVIIFKNYGPSAGTSLQHPHSQILAAPVVPRHIRARQEVLVGYHDDTGRCLYSDLRAHELGSSRRAVMETDRFVVFHPFASRRPFETWILPKANQASFGDASEEDIRDLAYVLRAILLKLQRGLNDPDFNYVIDSAPRGDEKKDYYLWHMRIIPRLTEAAGFEIGSGIYINTALPEQTAQFMRELTVE
jgi:UDPglucose--hexose-1-phosphate uridylyltransferase